MSNFSYDFYRFRNIYLIIRIRKIPTTRHFDQNFSLKISTMELEKGQIGIQPLKRRNKMKAAWTK